MPNKIIQLKVSKDGRLIIPRAAIVEAGLKPDDMVKLQTSALRKARMHRRTVLKLAGWGSLGVATIGFVSNFISVGTFFRDLYQSKVETDNALLARLFGVPYAKDGDEGVAIVPARHHPFLPLDKGAAGYEIETSCAASYHTRFSGTSYFERKINGLLEISPQDSITAFGSQVSNIVARDILGNPFGLNVLSRIPVPLDSDNPTKSIPLRWNLCSDPTATSRIRHQYGCDWEYKPHMFLDLHHGRAIQPKDDERSDLLLVTALPRDPLTHARIVIFAGLHGAGTQASGFLLDNPPLHELEGLEKQIDYKRYYQALFNVEVKDGKPTNVQLLEAEGLKWNNDPSRQLIDLTRI